MRIAGISLKNTKPYKKYSNTTSTNKLSFYETKSQYSSAVN